MRLLLASQIAIAQVCLVGALCTKLRIATSSFALSKLRSCFLVYKGFRGNKDNREYSLQPL